MLFRTVFFTSFRGGSGSAASPMLMAKGTQIEGVLKLWLKLFGIYTEIRVFELLNDVVQYFEILSDHN